MGAHCVLLVSELVSEADGRWSYYSAMASGQCRDATMAFRRAPLRRAGAGSCAGSASVCRIAAPPTAHGAALGPLGVLKAARKSTQFQGSNLDGLVALRRWQGSETHSAPIFTSLDADTPHASGLAPCERSRQELPPVGCLQELPPARSRQEQTGGQWKP